jgi:hypothetical protein
VSLKAASTPDRLGRSRRLRLADYRGPAAFGSEWEGWLTYAWHFMGHHIRLAEMVRLCTATREYLYDRHTPRRVKYAVGQRPILERLLEELATVHPRLAARRPHREDIAVFLADWVYWEIYRRGEVLRRGKWTQQIIEGGVEEQTVALIGRTGSFECSRVLATLLQMRRIPTRLVLLLGQPFTTRAAVEAYLDGGWRFFDVKANVQYQMRSGRLASLWEVATVPYCLRRGVRGEPNAEIDVRDRSAFEQLGLINYPVRPEIRRW